MIDSNRDLKTVLIDAEGRVYPSYLGDYVGKSFIETSESKDIPFPIYHDEHIILTILEKCHVSKRVLSKIKNARHAELRKVLTEEGMAIFYDWTNYSAYEVGDDKHALLYLPVIVSEALKGALIEIFDNIGDNYQPISAGVENLTKKQAKKYLYKDENTFEELVNKFKEERGISK